jgi:hypothetical protein
MNKFNFHFGDYYNDGHGQYGTVYASSPKTYEEIQAIVQRSDFKFPAFNNFYGGLATQYDEPHIGEVSWDEIIEMGYPYERFLDKIDDITYDKYDGWDALKDAENLSEIVVTIELVMDIYIFALNLLGAELTVEEPERNEFTFDYGYGCF